MPKRKHELTTLHEIAVHLRAFSRPLICHVDADEVKRMTSVLESANEERTERAERQRFYGFETPPGLECYVNRGEISKINVLDYLAGLPFEKPPKKSEADWSREIEERDASDDRVVLRIWMAAGEVDTYHDVNYQEWLLIRHALEESDQAFIGFQDEDDERVMIPVRQIAAVECFDEHYLSDEELARALQTDAGSGSIPG